MAELGLVKVVSALPGTLVANTIYAVRVGVGFDLYITTDDGSFAHKVNQEIKAPVGTVVAFAGFTLPSDYLWCDGSLQAATTYPDLATAIGGMYGVGNALAWTGSISGQVITTGGSHLLSVGDIIFMGSGLTITPSAGMNAAGTPLHVWAVDSATQFRVSQFPDGVTPLSGSGAGHAIYRSFNLPDLRGRVIAGRDNLGGSAAGRLNTDTGGFGAATLLGSEGGEQSHLLLSAQSGVPPHSHTHNLNSALTTTGGGQNYSVAAGPRVFGAIAINNNTAQDAAQAHPNVQPTLICNYVIRSNN